jgi:hypothetical protein
MMCASGKPYENQLADFHDNLPCALDGTKIHNENYIPTNFLKNQRATVNIHR